MLLLNKNNFIRILILFVFILFLILPINSVFSQNYSSSDQLYAIASNGKTDVVVGTEGNVIVSQNGSKWSREQSNIKSDLSNVVWLNNKFIITGDKGTLLISSDGIKWEKVSVDSKFTLLNTYYVNNKYVVSACSQNSVELFISNDCIKWSKIYISNINNTSTDKNIGVYYLKSYSLGIRDLVYFKNKYIAILCNSYSGNDMRENSYIMTSNDLNKWNINKQSYLYNPNSLTVETLPHQSILFASGTGILTTNDGVKWNVDYDEYKANAVSPLSEELRNGTKQGYISNIKNIGNKIVAVGYNTITDKTNIDLGVMSSYFIMTKIIGQGSGSDWSVIYPFDSISLTFQFPFPQPLNKIAVGNNRILFLIPGFGMIRMYNNIGCDTIYLKDKVIDINKDSQTFENIFENLILNDLVWNGKEFITIGNHNTICYSANGDDWYYAP